MAYPSRRQQFPLVEYIPLIDRQNHSASYSSYQRQPKFAATVTAYTGNNVNAGFTLIEIMVVLVILGVFAGMMTLSVGSSESRKNRAFYEHLIDSLQYVRLESAERMQPMGLTLKGNNEGQVSPVIMVLNNPYSYLENDASQEGASKNSMELSAMSRNVTDSVTPSWEVVDEFELPEIPPEVSIKVIPLTDGSATGSFGQAQQLHPWFVGSDVPQALWFGTGAASPARIEVRHNERLVGDAIVLLPDGRIRVDQ